MDSLLGPTLSNVFLCHFEEQWTSDCPIDYEHISYRRYVDVAFLLFSSEFYMTKLLNFMNSKHRNTEFTLSFVIVGNLTHQVIESIYVVVF